MNVLEDIRFEKSLPRENREQILSKIGEFVRAWQENPDPRVLNTRFSMKKVHGTTLLEEVWKFKVDDGNRVLFTKGKYIPFEEEGYEDALILLMFCNHDEQIGKARRLSKVMPRLDEADENEGVRPEFMQGEEDVDAWADRVADEKARMLGYNPEKFITRVFKHIGIEALVDLERLQGIYYLNKSQRECVNTDYRPLILFGSAGSGKTTIGVYKLVDLIKQNPDIKVGYFTYSNKLAQSAKKIFHTVLENELDADEVTHYEAQVDFHPLRDWLKEGRVDYIVQYDQFNEKFFIPLRQNWSMNPEYKEVILNLTGYEAWREIRGLLKGYAGETWQPDLDESDILSEETYMRLSGQHSLYNNAQRKVLYALALKYMEWQKEQGLLDENDLCRSLLRGGQVSNIYDWIVIDEVQDLTELEIYLLQTRVREAGNFLLSGDYHQTIAPTYFDTKRIMTLLEHHHYRYKEDANRLILNHNYRNPKQIVELANKLSHLRQQLLGKDKRNDYNEEIPMCEMEGNLYTLCGTKAEKIKLLKEAVKKAYVYIVVATEKEKLELEEVLENKIRIFTIYEVKGLENKYIIGVNLFSTFKEQWTRLIEQAANKGADEVLKESYFDRYMMNMLYVTLTRAQESFCFVEDEVDADFVEAVFRETKGRKDNSKENHREKYEQSHEEVHEAKNRQTQNYETQNYEIETYEQGSGHIRWMQNEVQFDEVTFGLREGSSVEDFYMEAQKFEAAEDYKRALAQYEKLPMPKAKARATFCKGKLHEEVGEFLEAGKCYESIRDFEEAAKVYKKAKAYKSYYECLMKWDEGYFMKEVLLNQKVDYNRDLKPYMTPYLKEKIKTLTLAHYTKVVRNDTVEKELATLWGEEINGKMQIATMILEELANE